MRAPAVGKEVGHGCNASRGVDRNGGGLHDIFHQSQVHTAELSFAMDRRHKDSGQREITDFIKKIDDVAPNAGGPSPRHEFALLYIGGNDDAPRMSEREFRKPVGFFERAGTDDDL